jgi:hypothetical protein
MARIYGPIQVGNSTKYIIRHPHYSSFLFAEWWDGWRYRWITVGCDASGKVVQTDGDNMAEADALLRISAAGVNDYADLNELIDRENLKCQQAPTPAPAPPPLPTVPYTAIDRNIDWRLATAGALTIALIIYIAYQYYRK